VSRFRVLALQYRPLQEPVTVGDDRPGCALGWRGQGVYLSWVVGGGLQHLGWKDAGVGQSPRTTRCIAESSNVKTRASFPFVSRPHR
jgi:hypothetical protein